MDLEHDRNYGNLNNYLWNSLLQDIIEAYRQQSDIPNEFSV